MAVRQYIGARYVPLYAGDWDSTKNYEPLTIVTDSNGNSFTSLKDVPAGTALTDRSYWIQTSSFSGSIDSLRRDINQAQDYIAVLDERIDAAEIEIAKIEDPGEVLTISDSYGTIVNISDKTAAKLFGECCNVTVREYANGGASFKAGTLLEGLRQFVVPDAAKIKTVIIFCGANDAWGTESAIIDGISDMISFIRSAYVNAKKIVLCCCGLTMSTLNGSSPEREKVVNAYVKGAYQNGITYLINSEAVLHNTALLQADKTHPSTTDGVLALAKMLVAAYLGDSVSVHERIIVKMTPASDAPEHLNLQTGLMAMTIDNDVARIQGRSTGHGLLGFNSGESGSITFNQGTFYTLCDLSDTIIDGITSNIDTCFTINGIVQTLGGMRFNGAFICCIEDQKLKGTLLANYLGQTVTDVISFTATDIEVVLPVNRF